MTTITSPELPAAPAKIRQPVLLTLQGLLFLLAAVPCGIPYRWNPNPVFPSELAAFAFCVLITLAGAFIRSEREEFAPPPWTSLGWISFAGFLGLQSLWLSNSYMTELVHPVLYALGAGGVAWAMSRAITVYGAKPLANMFAWGLLAGAIFNSGLSVPQIIQLIEQGPRLIFGNIGQKNLYGHYLAWGLAASAYLVTQKEEMPKWLFWVVGPWLALSLAYCGSRSPLMYAGIWLPFGALIWWRSQEQARQFGKALTIAAILIIAMQFIAPYISELLQVLLKAKHDVPTGLERLDSNGSRRLVEWHKAWLAFQAHPLTGLGWSYYPAQSIALQVRPEFAIVSESVLFTHCHNSVLNLLAETGLIGTSLVLGGIVWAFARLLRHWNDPVVLFATAMAIVSILHSLVEYPLWYFHFLGPFAVALVFMDHTTPTWCLPAIAARASWAAWGIVALIVAVLGGKLYMTLYPIQEPSSNVKQNAANLHTLEKLRNNPLADYYADFALSNYISANETDIDWKLALLRRQNSIRPYPGQLTDQAIMEAMKGNQERAHQLMREAAFSYPESFDYFYPVLDAFHDKPAVSALLHDVDEARQFFNDKLHFKIARPDPKHPVQPSKSDDDD